MTPTDLFDRSVTRRCALFGAGGIGAAAVLAACSSGSDGGSAAGTGAAASTRASSTPAASSSAAGTAAGSSSASAAAGAIASLSDIPVGGTAAAQVDGESVLLSQPTAGKVEAFSAVCPHQGGQVKPDGSKFRCSLHFSEFDIDGKVTKGPATKDLSTVAVSVSGDSVVKG